MFLFGNIAKHWLKPSFFRPEENVLIALSSCQKMVMLEMFVEEEGDIPAGEMLVMDEARNVFTIRFVNSLKDGMPEQKVQGTVCQEQERSC